MGISGLLPFLKEASTNGNIKEFAGQTVAVDTYCWIYRGAFSCAEELALDKPTDGSVIYQVHFKIILQTELRFVGMLDMFFVMLTDYWSGISNR